MIQMLVTLLLSAMSSYAFEVEMGTYVSKKCGKVVVSNYQGTKFNNQDVVIEYYNYSKDEGEYLDAGYTIFDNTYFSIRKISGLCMDEEINLQPILTENGPWTLKYQCGDRFSAIADYVEMEVNAEGQLSTFSFISNVASVSLSEKLFIPGLQEEKVRMECSNFIKE